MAKWDVEFDEREKSVIVDHANILEEQRKDYKGLLVIKVFQVHVEVPIPNPPPKTALLVKAAETAAEVLQKAAVSDVDALVKELLNLQKEEQHGNTKAGDTAEKLVEKVEKSLKKLADEFGAAIRKSVEKALIGGTKQKLMSTSRTVFRGMELEEDAFEGGGSEASPYVGELAKSLSSAGKEASKLTVQEKELRRDLAMEMGRVKDLIDKARGDKKDFDLREFAKTNTKDVRSVESAVSKYLEFLTSFQDKLEDAKKSWEKLDKLIDKDEKLEKDKDLNKENDAYWDALATLLANLPGKIEATKEAQRLFKSEYKDGSAWKDIIGRYEAQKGATKSGKALQDAGAALEKLTKG